jgi:hypothetical protein
MAFFDLKCDKVTNDIQILNGDLALVSEVEELQQRLLTRLRWFYGEYVFDTSKGMRYFEDILVKNPNLPNIENLLKSIISETDGVNKILSFKLEYDPKQRTASIFFEVDTVYGNLNVENLPLGV